MATPSIPPRPARASKASTTSSSAMEVPQVPGRPRRSVDRSVSPNRDTFARSPLNDPAFIRNGKPQSSSRLSGDFSAPPRPPSVTLPSIGQEGSEYGHLTPTPEAQQQHSQLETKTSNVSSDMPLHAPKASLPVSTAKQRIAAVTRTDSTQAAALGIGKASSSETDLGHALARSSSRQSQTGSRPASLYKQDTNDSQPELGIPMIGLHVPMYPNAGDVQAPTPTPSQPPPSKGIGFHNNVGGSSATPKHHSRTKSGREVFIGPPGSYGLHGHGVNKSDPLEKAWYDRHPEALAREARGEYGPAIHEDRKEYALSTEELNRLVHTKSNSGLAHPVALGTPDEDIGHLAADEYAQRLASRPGSTRPRRPSSQTFAESPLRKASFPQHELDGALADVRSSDLALDSEVEEDVIHVDRYLKSRRISSATPNFIHEAERERTPDVGGDDETPILASDEAAYRPESQYLHPAVESDYERRNSAYLDLDGPSRSQSRSNSVNMISQQHISHLADHRHENTGTPLEDVKEYEPLFPDEDEPRSGSAPAAITSPTKKRSRKPDLARHHFPSQDVWEDTPDSLRYVTTVDSPQLPDDSHPSAEHEPKHVYESPEAEEARKQKAAAPSVADNLLKPRLKADVAGDIPVRQGMQRRFPSQDIWEDTPDSMMYTTTIDPEQEEESSPVTSQQPQIPARPSAKSQPAQPDRPKPQVPLRPSRLRSSEESQEPLSKTLSKESSEDGVADTTSQTGKMKPAVPARPAGGKIAALQANFMSDLNKKLGLGPQAPKKEEPQEPEVEEEKAPLADARKGRARGPQRRRPAASSPSGAAEENKAPPTSFRFTISRPQTIWEVDEGVLSVVPFAGPAPASEKVVAPRDVEAAEDSQADPVSSDQSESLEEKTQTGGAVDTAVQTGEQKLGITHPNGETERATAYVGGKAPEEGTVVVTEDGEEHVSSAQGSSS